LFEPIDRDKFKKGLLITIKRFFVESLNGFQEVLRKPLFNFKVGNFSVTTYHFKAQGKSSKSVIEVGSRSKISTREITDV
jgi:hypothetical protein